MDNSALKNYQADLQNKRAKLNSILQPYLQAQTIKNELQSIDSLYEKISDAKPEIMLYGIYNAGKSSILNELLGSDRAKVDDIPTTDRIDCYEWNGYRIVDTPGVDAPIEHEKVTEEHLEQADVVLFVISAEGSHEYLENYRRLKSIAERGKKIIIVLNDKEGKLCDPGKGYDQLTDEQQTYARELSEVKRKIGDNCRAVDLQDKDYVIVAVNAKRARKGRIEGKNNLIKLSNIKELESIVLSELKRMPTLQNLQRTVFEIEHHLDNIVKVLEKAENSGSVQVLNDFLERLHAARKEVRENIAAYIERRAGRLGKELPDPVWAHREEGQEAINRIVSEKQQDFCRDVQGQMQIIFQDFVDSLRITADNMAAKIEKIQISLNADMQISPLVSAGGSNSAAERDDWDSTLASIAKLQQMLGQKPSLSKEDMSLDKSSGLGSGIVQGAILAPLAETIAAGVANSSIGAALSGTVLAPVLGGLSTVAAPLVLGICVLKSLFGGGSREEERISAENAYNRRVAQAQLQARQELQQRCQYLAEGIGDKIRLEAEKILSRIIDEAQLPFKEQAQKSRDEAHKRILDLDNLRDLYNEYDVLRMELGALS